MNHTAICIDRKSYVRENHLDEERNKESCRKEGHKKGPGKEEEVTRARASGISINAPPVLPGAFLFLGRRGIR
jgi:hypothetical protein